MVHAFAPLARALNWSPLPFIFSAGIIAVAAYVWHRFFWSPVTLLRGAIVEMSGLIRGTDLRMNGDAFATINERFRADPILAPAWERYVAEVYVYKPRGAAAQLISINPSSAFFNFENVIGSKINLGLIGSIPNILLGLGLCLTFVGLIAALYFASRGVAASTPEQAKLALGALLHAATFKFVTSLVGLASSIAFTLGERWYSDRLSRELTELIAALDSRIPVWSAERIQYATLDEARRQTALLEALATEHKKLEPTLKGAIDIVADAVKAAQVAEPELREPSLAG